MTISSERRFEITVLGRTLEHLGTQMYKRRDVALAELVANAWDAGATNVSIDIPAPDSYDQRTSLVSVTDDGVGMTADEVDDHYLVIGRNRRTANQEAPNGRPVMGRKGVGKLAGFGLGRKMKIHTWRDSTATTVELDGMTLKADGGEAKKLELVGSVGDIDPNEPFTSGTRISMSSLKHKTPPDIDGLHRSLARRFSRAVVGEMLITINGEPLREPEFDFTSRFPETGESTEVLSDGEKVTWWAGFSSTTLTSELQGFTILVNGKTAQAPPYFFEVEGTASGQHGTKYLTGVIEADFLDAGSDDESDRISTDRQEIDWDDESTAALKDWGDALTRRLLRERITARGESAQRTVENDPNFASRLAMLDEPSRKKAQKFIRALGTSDTPDERITDLADTIIQAFEYQQFHDYISELDEASEDPVQFAKALSYIQGWRMLESRALLEVIKGRIEIVEKFFKMVVDNAPETAPAVGSENMHDLLGRYPWLLNPEWQVLAEERTLTKQLQEWGDEDVSPEDRSRYDFLAFNGEGETIVVEIKRSGHPVVLDDLHQLDRYVERLSQGRANVRGAFVTGRHYALTDTKKRNWEERDDIEMLTWDQVHRRAASHYENYRAILAGDATDGAFQLRGTEVAMTRNLLNGGSIYRGPAERKSGLGPQNATLTGPEVVASDSENNER